MRSDRRPLPVPPAHRTRPARPRPALGLAFAGLFVLAACDEPPPPTPAELPPIVGTMEVPISLRNDGPRPTEALRIEANASEMHLDGRALLTLERGRFARSDLGPDGAPTALRTALQAAPARSRATLTLHGMVGYGTLARTVLALTAAGHREISLAVRPVSTSGAPPTSMGWLPLTSPTVVPWGRDPVDPAAYGGGGRPWSDFVGQWRNVYEACRAAGAERYIDCDMPGQAPAEGGFLQTILWARGQGMMVRFQRVGAPPPEPTQAARPQLIEGVRAAPTGEGEELPPDPSVTGAFNFRAETATMAESPISATVRPVCGAAPCQVVVESDEETPIMRVLSFVGAAFPNGSPPPVLVLRLPR